LVCGSFFLFLFSPGIGMEMREILFQSLQTFRSNLLYTIYYMPSPKARSRSFFFVYFLFCYFFLFVFVLFLCYWAFILFILFFFLRFSFVCVWAAWWPSWWRHGLCRSGPCALSDCRRPFASSIGKRSFAVWDGWIFGGRKSIRV
jgi:hypothetical protein